ncbi:unnamed protein product [Mytilus edulis]|uniref:Uncharacterized protein n=1 Tax=Mytilus edulis TaxID=6550 RepID=A0A8S3TBL7_MYTED|nr:unnamed protein product [Mytilus edulis]
MGVKHVKALFILLGKQLFTFEAKCIILDNLGSLAETKYLTYFKESSVNADMKDVKMAESEKINNDNERNLKEISKYKSHQSTRTRISYARREIEQCFLFLQTVYAMRFSQQTFTDLESIKDHFDFSEYPHSHYPYSDKYRKETGKFRRIKR